MAEREPISAADRRSELPGAPKRRRLYRSAANRSLAGVCGGLAERLGVDSALVRIPWLLSVPLTGGLTLLLYLVLAAALPEETPADRAAAPVRRGDSWQRAQQSRVLTAALILLLAGLLLTIESLGLLPLRVSEAGRRLWSLAWPLSLAGLGLGLLAWINRRRIPWERLQRIGRGLPLRRSRRQRLVAGVCGGLAEQLRVDPLLVRLAWGVLTVVVLGVVGVLLYVAAALVLPAASAQD
ncbi:MAG: PspC domain-containing protein [Caldilineales bacterium]|nr:PspC domain-containing protein [Caldilineales bacterium]MDW8318156.1 PspC domain-containing protein [Anaerolineae bacterium]